MLTHKIAQTKQKSDGDIQRVIEAIRMQKMSFVVFFVSPVFDFHKVHQMFKEAYPSNVVIGCVSQGEVTGEGYTEGTLTAFSVYGDDFQVEAIALTEFKTKGMLYRGKIKQSIEKLGLSSNDRALNKKMFAMTFLDGFIGAEEKLSVLLQMAIPDSDLSLIGGSCGNMNSGTSFISLNDSVYTDAVVMLLVKTNKKIKLGREDLYEIKDGPYRVTEANIHKRTVKSIDNKPIGDMYRKVYGIQKSDLVPKEFGRRPIGFIEDNQVYIASPIEMLKSQEISFYRRVPIGMGVYFMQSKDCLKEGAQTADSIKQEIGSNGIIIGVSCVLRYSQFEQENIKKEMAKSMDKVAPFVGYTSLGEQMSKVCVNQTLTYLAISE